jgi:hypothetical protein
VGATFIVANAGTRAFFGTGIVPFLTEGWLTDVTGSWRHSDKSGTGSGSSYALSLSEIVKGMIPGGEGSGAETYSWNDMSGMRAVVGRSMREFGPQAIATVIVVPIGAKLLKRIARKPIADVNKLLKWSGVQGALGVKV